MGATDRRLPAGPLQRRLVVWARNSPDHPTHADIALAIGVDRSQATRIMRADSFRLRYAEDLCDRLGIHPTDVWGDDYYIVALRADLDVPVGQQELAL